VPQAKNQPTQNRRPSQVMGIQQCSTTTLQHSANKPQMW
jgi:hypothetical protein